MEFRGRHEKIGACQTRGQHYRVSTRWLLGFTCHSTSHLDLVCLTEETFLWSSGFSIRTGLDLAVLTNGNRGLSGLAPNVSPFRSKGGPFIFRDPVDSKCHLAVPVFWLTIPLARFGRYSSSVARYCTYDHFILPGCDTRRTLTDSLYPLGQFRRRPEFRNLAS